ncbi:MAG: hypothetical protein HY597_02705 [Candidatus Omnitrophica bacterium]|nr:hypothetical protein [Candidatus Omnitrophota bacterium]
MIAINLLSKELQRKAMSPSPIALGKLPKQIAVAVGAVLAAVHLLLLIMLLWSQADAARLGARWKKLSGPKQQVDAVKAEVAKLQERVVAFDTITKERFLWSHKLRQLGDAVIDGVWLSELYLERQLTPAATAAKGRAAVAGSEQLQLVLKGSAAMPDAEGAVIVGRFMENLKAHAPFFQDFREIVSGGLQSRKIREVEIMDFTVSAPLRRQTF